MALARSSMINLITFFNVICGVAALRSGRDVHASSDLAIIERDMESGYAGDLRQFIMSEYWLGGLPPAECGRVPNPLHKSYWDCFYDKHLSLISSSSSAGHGGSNTATQLLVEAPSDCNDARTLEDLFCQSGNTQDCLNGVSSWGECESCLMDDYTRQLYRRCSSEHGQPYETLTKVENIPDNPYICANNDKSLKGKVKVFCETLDGVETSCVSTEELPFFIAIDKQQCSSMPISVRYKFINMNDVEVIIEETTTILVGNKSMFQRDGGPVDEESIFNTVISVGDSTYVSFDTYFDTCDTNILQLYVDLHLRSTTSIPTTYVQCGMEATAAVEYLNPLQQCAHEATPEGVIPNVDLWRCMYSDLKSEYSKPEGFDFFQMFIGYTGYALPSGCSPGQNSNTDEEYIHCASESVRTIIADDPPPKNALDLLRENIDLYSGDILRLTCGDGTLAIPDEITLEYWQCFYENYEKMAVDLYYWPGTRKRFASEVDSWGIFLEQLSMQCTASSNPFKVDGKCLKEDFCSECIVNSSNVGGSIPTGVSFFQSFLAEKSDQILPEQCSYPSLGNDAITDCFVQFLFWTPGTTFAPTDDRGAPDVNAGNRFQGLIDESKANAIVQIVSSTISFICSIAIICVIYRSYIGLSSTFHRLLMALSISYVISSFWMMLATAPAPRSTEGYVWNPRGNVHSCNTQGFFLYLGIMAAPLFNCSLCFYYLAVIKYNKKDAYIRAKLEPFLLAIPVATAIILATTILSMKSFNPSDSKAHCWIAEGEPYMCDEEGGVCWKRGEGNYRRTLYSITVALLYTLLPCVIAVTMTIMHRATKKNETKLSRYGVDSLRPMISNHHQEDTIDDDDTEVGHGLLGWLKMAVKRLSCRKSSGANGTSRSDNARKQSWVIFEEALLYSFAYVAAYIFPFIQTMFYWAGREIPFGLNMAASIMFPLQGFFTFLVFIYPRVRSARKKTQKGWFQSLWAALKSRGDKKNRPRNLLPKSSLKNKKKPNETQPKGSGIKKLKKWSCMGEGGNTNEMLTPLNASGSVSTGGLNGSGSSEQFSSSPQSKGCLNVICKSGEIMPSMSTKSSRPLHSIKEDEESGLDSQPIEECEDEQLDDEASYLMHIREIIDGKEDQGRMPHTRSEISSDQSVSSTSIAADDQPLLKITQRLASDQV